MKKVLSSKEITSKINEDLPYQHSTPLCPLSHVVLGPRPFGDISGNAATSSEQFQQAQVATLRLLVDAKANNFRDSDRHAGGWHNALGDESPLHFAVEQGNLAVVNVLLELGCDPHVRIEHWTTYATRALEDNDAHPIDYLQRRPNALECLNYVMNQRKVRFALPTRTNAHI